jgi:dihydrofolate synthase / folylpolyglutamate synthase
MPTYDTAVASLLALGHELAHTPSHKFDLAHMRALLAEMGRPEQKFPSVLIAGTNGKGSTAATLAAILQAAGYRTGLYTSPHLVRVNERIRINGAAIEDDEFAALHERVDRGAGKLVEKGDLPWHPSFFEMLTAMAFLYFAELPVDIAVLEVGMGGRLDATNVVEPRVSVITDIALDHQKFLGNTIAEIAREKAGIIHATGVVVTLPQMPEANDEIGNAILERGARGISATAFMPSVSPKAQELQVLNSSGNGEPGCAQQYRLRVMGEEIEVATPLAGRHQLRNIALALATAEELARQGFKINASDVAKGLRQTRWPGRLQSIERDGVQFLFDVAHNPAGAWSLRSALSDLYEGRPLTFVFGAMRDKAIGEMAEILFPLAQHVIVTHAESPRAAKPEEIEEAAARLTVELEEAPDVATALCRARSRVRAGGLVVVTGSIYVVGEAMRELRVQV